MRVFQRTDIYKERLEIDRQKHMRIKNNDEHY